MILQTCCHVQVAVRVENADRIPGPGTRRGALFLVRTTVAAFEVAPEIDDFSAHGRPFTFRLCEYGGRRTDQQRRHRDRQQCVSHRGLLCETWRAYRVARTAPLTSS